MNFTRIRHMLVKEFIHVFRDPRMRMVILVVPVLQLLVFGYAVTSDVRNVATAVCDLDRSVASRELVARFERSGYFRIVRRLDDVREIDALLDRGEVRAAIRIDHGFGAALDTGRTAPVQLLLDGTDSNTAGIVLDYSARIVAAMSERIALAGAARTAGVFRPPGGVELEVRAWFNENFESRNYFVPGVIAALVMLVTLLLTSMAVVREKEIGTMEQVMVTPITPGEFIMGKTLPFALIAFVNVAIITTVGVFWFEVPIRGHLIWLFLATALYLMTALGAGLLISTISRTQQQAMMSAFFFFFPAVLLSGFIFPIANMPRVVQLLTYADPLRYFLIIIRGIFLKGIGPAILWPQMAALAAMGIAALWTATRRLKMTMG